LANFNPLVGARRETPKALAYFSRIGWSATRNAEGVRQLQPNAWSATRNAEGVR